MTWISYFETDDTAWSASGQLRLATKEDGEWTHSYQDNGAGKGSEIGIDSGGLAHIAYFDEDGASLNFSKAGQKSPAVMGDSDFRKRGHIVGISRGIINRRRRNSRMRSNLWSSEVLGSINEWAAR